MRAINVIEFLSARFAVIFSSLCSSTTTTIWVYWVNIQIAARMFAKSTEKPVRIYGSGARSLFIRLCAKNHARSHSLTHDAIMLVI